MSNINYIAIDEQYPVQGQDNSSQGFRDNFNYIKTNFQYAKSEIEYLQDHTAKINEDNNFNGVLVGDANLLMCTEKFHNNGILTSPTNISFSNGSYQKAIVGNDITLTLMDWPEANRLGRLWLEVYNSPAPEAPHTITFTAGNGKTLLNQSGSLINSNGTLIVSSTVSPIILEFFSHDGGENVFVRTIGTFAAI
jgi:hypothetical protein